MKSHSDCVSSLALWFLEVTEGNSTSLLVKSSQECCFIAVWWINFTEGTSIVQESKMLLKTQEVFLIVLKSRSSFPVSSVTKSECLKIHPDADTGLLAALCGRFQMLELLPLTVVCSLQEW